jgi:hypothetical protein
MAPNVADAGGKRVVERHQSVCGDAAKHCTRPFVLECAVCQPFSRAQRLEPEPREREGMLGHTEWPEHGTLESRPMLYHCSYRVEVGIAIST